MREQKKILIVEDEAVTALLMKNSLTKAGFDVFNPVATGEAAIRAVDTDRPDIVLMDINLAGEIDGIEAAAQIQRHSNVPFIFVTGYAENDVRERALALHPAGYVIKPVVFSSLLSAIAAAVRQ